MLLTLSRIIKTSFQHIRRNVKLSVASSLIMALTFFVSSVFLMLLYGAGIVLNYFEHQSQIIVFFNPDNVNQDYVNQIETTLQNQGVPVSLHYVSKDEAYKKFVEFLNQDSPSITQSVNKDKLPPSLEIKTTNIDDLEKLANVLYSYQNKSSNIDKILYYKNVEDFLKEFIKILRYCAVGFILFLGSISFLIIWITTGIALSTHADEIEIMDLVGATRSYIELPYIFEGAIYGVIGSFASSVLLFLAYVIVTHVFSSTYLVFASYFKGIPIPAIGIEQIVLAIIIEMVIGAVVGSIGSFLALRNKMR